MALAEIRARVYLYTHMCVSVYADEQSVGECVHAHGHMLVYTHTHYILVTHIQTHRHVHVRKYIYSYMFYSCAYI